MTPFVKVEDLSKSRYGKRPEERSLEELLDAGMVVVDKPQGPTSHQVSAWVRDLLGLRKTAHGGTLDPRVTGVLPIALSDAVRALDALHVGDKEYVAVLRLHQDVPEERVREVMEEFVGEIYQMPPVRAAVKRELRVRRIYEMEILDRLGRDYLFRVCCESGTYIRTLCVDLGEALGVGGHMQDLRRTRTAGITEEDAVSLNDLRDAFVFWKEEGDETGFRKIVRPMEDLLRHLRKVVVKDTAVGALCHGASLAAPGIMEIDSGITRGDLVAIFTRKGEVVALGAAQMNSEQMLSAGSGVAVGLERVLMNPGTYPDLWK
ncbi:MAG: RNA-guided pseudouridylation complex pseudouridine synthase subunit Cbf5 [Thermoplasmata archaeon]